MPSWNIHTAHAERLLAKNGADALGICDVDAFLLGNLLPDLYVGYMVPNISKKIEYKDTHLASPDFVPEPRFWEFFERYGTPGPDGKVSDLVLGSWAHLVADHDYNMRTNDYLLEHGIAPGTETRIKKQSDFDLFGRTLDISLSPHITPEVLRQCATYSPYPLGEQDIRQAQEVMEGIVRENSENHLDETPPYLMLTDEFFSSLFEQVTNRIRTGLLAYATGDPDWGARR